MRGWLIGGLLTIAASAVGCNDQVTSLFGAACASCTNENGVITNLGPSASPEACQEWGAENRCAEAELLREGQCGGDLTSNATCVVAACADDPSAGCPGEN